MLETNKKQQQRKVARKQRDNQRKQGRRIKETYGFTMDMLIDADNVEKLRKVVRK